MPIVLIKQFSILVKTSILIDKLVKRKIVSIVSQRSVHFVYRLCIGLGICFSTHFFAYTNSIEISQIILSWTGDDVIMITPFAPREPYKAFDEASSKKDKLSISEEGIELSDPG